MSRSKLLVDGHSVIIKNFHKSDIPGQGHIIYCDLVDEETDTLMIFADLHSITEMIFEQNFKLNEGVESRISIK